MNKKFLTISLLSFFSFGNQYSVEPKLEGNCDLLARQWCELASVLAFIDDSKSEINLFVTTDEDGKLKFKLVREGYGKLSLDVPGLEKLLSQLEKDRLEKGESLGGILAPEKLLERVIAVFNENKCKEDNSVFESY